jgi:outer membrane lipoprotein-sorting protein
VEHPVPRRNFRYHKALIFIDDQLNIPVRFEAYDWPKQEGGQPLLLEEYTYVNVKFNVGLTDADFDPRNPNYKFYKK